ncbi:unnamed protein product [Linum tenue]|uniref:Uncharacterized protein n=1 Tax=Linum tenue TaxID=586396 RepID=A0AAV0GZN0_9ROSI|nr:unnamed protein product [Linum tenue]
MLAALKIKNFSPPLDFRARPDPHLSRQLPYSNTGQRHHSSFNRRQLQFQKAKSMDLGSSFSRLLNAGFPLQSKLTRPVPTIGACITSLSACKVKTQSRAHLLPRLPSPCIPIESASIAQHNGHSSHQKQPGSLRF